MSIDHYLILAVSAYTPKVVIGVSIALGALFGVVIDRYRFARG